jgi:aquaporin Z
MDETPLTARRALLTHWPEYLMEAWGLATIMVVAGVMATLLEHPASPLRSLIADPLVRRLVMGLAVGGTLIAVIHSPWGKQSGAHINPATTLAFLRLGKIRAVDALFYVLAHVTGALAGVLAVWAVLGAAFADPPVFFINTLPGADGEAVAFAAETAMAFGLMLMVVTFLSSPRLTPRIGVAAGLLVVCYITFLAPLSGMSLNPARTLASAAPAGMFGHLWIYVTAPVLGMILAIEAFRAGRLGHQWFCAKLNHDLAYRCIHCGHDPHRHPVATCGDPAPAAADRGSSREILP